MNYHFDHCQFLIIFPADHLPNVLKNYILTIGSRYLVAILNLVIVLLSSRYLGAAGLGFVSLFVLGIAINQQISSFAGGSALVYLTPRSNIKSLLLIAYSGAFLVHLLLIPFYFGIQPFDLSYFPSFFGISLAGTFSGINFFILLGKQQIKAYNVLSTMQILIQTLVFSGFVLGAETLSVNHYILASGAGYLISLAGSSAILMKEFRGEAAEKLLALKNILKYGFYSETANVFQLFSYRLSYFLINRWIGIAALGEFSLAVQLTESLRIFSRSIATVEYVRYSNLPNPDKFSMLRQPVLYSFLFTLTGLVILLILPDTAFAFLFGESYPHLKIIINILSPGILFLSAGTVIAPYFSGQGKHHVNTLGSALSLAITVVFSFLLIPSFGVSGAAAVNTLAYTVLTLFLFFSAKRQ